MSERVVKLVLWVAFVATVYGANWAIGRYGLVSVGFGLMAPAGVYFAGLAFGLRDGLHNAAGASWRLWVLSAIAAGGVLSALLADAVTLPDGFVLASAGEVAFASAVAFTLAELADLAVYEPLRKRGFVRAAIASNLVGAVIDSALFLWLAFGSLDHLQGQVLGKAYMVAPAIFLVWWQQRRVACAI